MRRTLLVLVLTTSALGARAAPPVGLLVNGDFSAWEGGVPSRWSVAIGATNGEGEPSAITRGPEGGIRLSGRAATKRWHIVSQPLEVEAGTVLRLTCEARALGLRQDEGQFGSAYVGIAHWKAADGTFVGVGAEHELREVFTPVDVAVRVRGGTRAGPAVFLSKSGALDVRGVRCEAVPPDGAYDLLVAQIERHYSFLAMKAPSLPGKSFALHARGLRERAMAAQGEDALSAVLVDLLAPLADIHVRIHRTDGRFVYPFMPSTSHPNVNGKALKKALGELTMAGRAGFVADLEGDLGYLASTSLEGLDADHAKLRSLLRGLFAKRGLLLDLRGNGGGDETRARALVGLLTEVARPYARRRMRNGPRPDDFGPPIEAVLRPEPTDHPYRGPIVVLLGPMCVSSGEGMAQMLDVLPNVRTVGQPTFGASGSPAPLPLPGGMDVWFSRWVDEQMDGTALEGRGVQPDVVIAHEGPGDPTLAAAIAELRRLVAAADK